jgi:hypothetical protein
MIEPRHELEGVAMPRANQQQSVIIGDVVASHPGGPLPPLPLHLCRCPVCTGSLDFSRDSVRCNNPTCASQPAGFPVLDGRPVLVDFANSVIDRNDLLAVRGVSKVRRHRLPGVDRRLHMRLYDAMFGTDQSAVYAADDLQKRLHQLPHRPRVLVIGGGTIGGGMQALYDNSEIDVIAFDVYNSAHVQFIADGHSIPMVDGVFDAVWIQAVLEHVLEPDKVVLSRLAPFVTHRAA